MFINALLINKTKINLNGKSHLKRKYNMELKYWKQKEKLKFVK